MGERPTETDEHMEFQNKGGGSKPIRKNNHGHKPDQKAAPPHTEQESATITSAPVFSSQRTIMDYVTLKGIENRTGIEKQNLYGFVLKELLDNGIDFQETQSRNQKNDSAASTAAAQLEVTISKVANYLRIQVGNSNICDRIVFTREKLKSIFNFDTFYSSKRNQYKITRGALGDAFKEILCIPYALAKDQNLGEWNEPLVIRSQQSVFLVKLIIDRVKQTIHAEIIEEKQEHPVKFTEIEVHLPIPDDGLDLIALRNFLIDYSTFNTHVGFTIRINDTSEETLNFPQLQPINTEWTNLTSVYYCSFAEFENFIFGLEDNEMPLYDVIQKTFREGSNMKKDKAPKMTAGQLKQSPLQIRKLYDDMRNTMKPLATPSKLSLPFDVSKTVRMEALRKRLEQQGVRASNMNYGSKFGHYSSSTNGVEIPSFFEIAVIQSDDVHSNLQYTEGLNSAVFPNQNSFLIGENEDTFQWETTSDRQKKSSHHKARSIFDVLSYSGYSYNEEKCKKPHSLVIANLISPRINYKSYGKSVIDLTPFTDVIAQTTAKVCSLGGNHHSGSNSSGNEPSSIIGFLRQLLKERRDAVAKDPIIKEKQRWTQSTVFYHLRPILLNQGWSIEEIDRGYITKQIKSVCEELGVKREEIGIIAADRAQLYFKDEWHDVGLDDIIKLAKYGTDMLIIEKEGIVEQLAPYADENGIALLNTRGFLTEYASILSEESEKQGCNVAILTDFDASGLLIAKTVPSVYRIGIDFKTLDYLGIHPGIVEETYNPKPNHIKPLEDWANTKKDHLFSEEVDYVRRKRVEIDSVLARLNNNAKVWEFVRFKFQERFPTRNYNRAIDIPEYVIPDCVEELNDMVREKAVLVLKEERAKMEKRFSNNPGFLDVSQYDKSIPEHFKNIIEHDDSMKPLLEKIEGVIEEFLEQQ
ncbi:MAG TPA: hypothetical protein VEL11_12860 [Candidatus Bathyarchaeia archaeon]|nr:hypothetical protein [Candidatus Bathyarchaeia archaeon]